MHALNRLKSVPKSDKIKVLLGYQGYEIMKDVGSFSSLVKYHEYVDSKIEVECLKTAGYLHLTNSNMTHDTRKQTLRSLSLSYRGAPILLLV